jgi:hypothetical protein
LVLSTKFSFGYLFRNVNKNIIVCSIRIKHNEHISIICKQFKRFCGCAVGRRDVVSVGIYVDFGVNHESVLKIGTVSLSFIVIFIVSFVFYNNRKLKKNVFILYITQKKKLNFNLEKIFKIY